jgi:hypothetical protein
LRRPQLVIALGLDPRREKRAVQRLLGGDRVVLDLWPW